ncbi:MAG: hypothetical protein ABIU77_08220 [Ferruginibacter sp.]
MNESKKENQYSRVAKEAYQHIVHRKMQIIDAWVAAAENNIASEESRKKGCPKSAFVGLCESGDLKDIKMLAQSDSINYKYVKFAISEWKKDAYISKAAMWSKIRKQFPGGAIDHQGQLDVLKGVWEYLH